ncbi:molybdopterin-binding protein [Donghicola sp. XS_ASV15]|uniref:molybdopterin-binding protein n=1 Tax=Donghicola sp. XS_ASV15 TaxID=3241295 RepID=UPI0035190471
MFDRIAILDWSAAGTPKTGKDSIWLAIADGSGVRSENIPTRMQAEARLNALMAEGDRLLIGVDFSLSLPAAALERLGVDAAGLWRHLATNHTDTAKNLSNYRNVAAELNQRFEDDGLFWGNGAKADTPHLPRTKPTSALPEWRACEEVAQSNGLSPKSCWQLAGAGAVGAQSLTGMPMVHRLRERGATVWPLDPISRVTIAEVYPSILSAEVRAHLSRHPDMVPDQAQVELLAQALWVLNAGGTLPPLFDVEPTQEGHILGLNHELSLRAAVPSAILPPRLRNDCFAMPQGVNWVPVDAALDKLKQALHPIKGVGTINSHKAQGRILAADAVARRSNPPRPNSAVDGYGFAYEATGDYPQKLPLLRGRAAAGQPFDGAVPHGAAVRILTGAILPDGVDTVVLEEDCALDGASVVFDGPVKPRANTRKAGEDVEAGQTAIHAGQILRAPDIALLSALGIAEVQVYEPLRVGVLSTGDEIIARPDMDALPHQIFDANRPMLLSLLNGWGYEPVDLGHCKDDPKLIERTLDRANVDVILTSGGASAGDEDHVSHLLRTKGTLSSWRIALKPGRPLALAMWDGTPVFGLPGNPVAALVCALVFARPALSLMAGSGWAEPVGFTVPAAFEKRKKAGRREYLRARLNDQGMAEVFKSEGSGRISGLSWADGLVELPDEAAEITNGTPVKYIPYAMLGLR